jgi:cytochrome b subunit of formate dehydrogenase
MIETNKKIIGAGAVILIITGLIIIARKKSWVKFGPWISMQEKSEIEKRSKTTPLLLILLLLLIGMAYLFLFHRNVLIYYVSRSWESKIGPAVLFGSFLVLSGLIIYSPIFAEL